MQTFEETNISDTSQNLQFIAYGLSYEAQQAWTFTRYNIEHFLTEHPSEILSPDGKGEGELADELTLSYEQRHTTIEQSKKYPLTRSYGTMVSDNFAHDMLQFRFGHRHIKRLAKRPLLKTRGVTRSLTIP